MGIERSNKKLYNIGLSYKKADVETRGAFSISKENQVLLIEDAKLKGLDELVILSTCNRTEITGFANHPYELIELLCKYSKGTVDDFIKVSSIHKNKDAVDHLFRIGTGLESQILGDYEIVSQLKQAFVNAKQNKSTGAYMERLFNSVLQASKEVKNKTLLSSGTTSTSYAAIRYALNEFPDMDSKSITVLGLGDIGKNTCKNIVEYSSNKNITIVNRTHSKAIEFAKDYQNLEVKHYEELKEVLKTTDILFVATGANAYTITKEHLCDNKNLLILDLSMPENVDVSVKKMSNNNLVNVHELSKITDKTLEKRKEEIPKTEAIISKYKREFGIWVDGRKFTPAINALKESLKEMQQNEINYQSKKIENFNREQAEAITDRFVQKITTQFIKHLKTNKCSINDTVSIMGDIFEFKNI